MKEVWKFTLSPDNSAKMEVPVGAKPLFVGLDPSGTPCLWMEVDPLAMREAFPHVIVGTGHPIPPKATTYLGSFVLSKEMLVFHVYTK